jgi:hypothetical protein
VSQPDSTTPPAKATLFESGFEVLLIVVVFFLHAGWPVPDVNEAHYLCKAKHYWDSAWGSGDFFLESVDAHAVFYWTFGWLTMFFELSTVAWIGRALTWLLLAWSWRRLSWTIAPKPLLSVLTAALLVALIDWTHMAGEWLVGGVEAKGFAYAFVFLALEAANRSRWRWVWPLLGVASSLHPLVGGWSTLAAMFAWWWIGPTRPPLRSMLPWLFLGLLFALPGLYFSLRLTFGIDPEIVRQANEIYVFRRLPHHVVIWEFSASRTARHLAAVIVFLLVCLCWRSERQETLRGWVLGSLIISVVGAFASLVHWYDENLSAALLRYYWYRLGDIAVPVGLALMAAGAITALKPKRSKLASTLLIVLMAVAGWHLWQQSRDMYGRLVPRGDGRITRAASPELREERMADWLDACRWAREHTQPSDVFLTPRMNQTFKWHANRPEVVSRKDIPQDAHGIVEWWQRCDDLYRYELSDGVRKWRGALADQGQEHIEEMGWKYGAKYALVEGNTPLKIRRIGMTRAYFNASFTIYQLPPKPE